MQVLALSARGIQNMCYCFSGFAFRNIGYDSSCGLRKRNSWYIDLWNEYFQPWYNPLRLTGLKAPTNWKNHEYKIVMRLFECHASLFPGCVELGSTYNVQSICGCDWLKEPSSSFPLNLSACLIGQLFFHSTSIPLHLHIVCFLVGSTENEEIEGKENTTNTNC